jgi:hypothetical protein
VYAPSPLPVVAAQPGLQVYGNVGVAQPISVYFNTPQSVTATPATMFYTQNSPNLIKNPVFVTGTLDGWDTYTAASVQSVLMIPAILPNAINAVELIAGFFVSYIEQNLQPYLGSELKFSVWAMSQSGQAGNLQIQIGYVDGTTQSQVYTVPTVAAQITFFPTQAKRALYIAFIRNQTNDTIWLTQFYGAVDMVNDAGIVPVSGNVGVAQPVSVYFATPQSIVESNQPQPPFQVYGSQPGVQVYGNVGVAQPVSVYFATPQKVVEAQPVQVYGSAGLAPVNVYDTQVFSDSNQVFSGLIGAGTNQNLQIVPPQANLSFSASLIDIWNVYSVAETVALRFGSTGLFRFLKNLNPSTGFMANLVNSTWRGPTNTGLNIYTFETMGGPFPAAGGFVTYTVMGQYLP